MKTTQKAFSSIITVAVALTLGSVGYAANSGSSNASNTQRSSNTNSANAASNQAKSNQSRSGVTPLWDAAKGQRLSDVIGREVRDSSGKEVGNIKDLVVDRDSGEIRFVLVSTGGLLGVADTVRAVPPGAISSDGNGACKVSLNETKWRNAPTVADNQLSALRENQRGQQIYDYYGQQWKSQSSSSGNSGLAYATEIKGKDITSNGHKVGEIDDLMVHLQKQKVSAIVDPNDDFAGTESKYVISFDHLKPASSRDGAFTTDLSRSDFDKATAMTDELWIVPTYVAIYTWEAPLASNDGSKGGASTASANNNTTNQQPPLDAVRKAIASDTSDGGQKVAVSAQNGHVVLKGTVKSEDAKERIENKAEKAANGCPVDNQIQVANAD